MTRTATICLCSLLLLLGIVVYRQTRVVNHAVADMAPLESEDTSIVLPAVSSAWSNMNARLVRTPSTKTSGRVELEESMTASNEPSTEVAMSADALAARTKDLLAHAALETVGVDPEAEQFWLAAINDPNVPSEERHDLIGSLSEAGFADARRVTPDDLPLIASRIALIEELAPSALDSVNAAAFQDAYRDLLNMFGSLITSERAIEPDAAPDIGTGE